MSDRHILQGIIAFARGDQVKKLVKKKPGKFTADDEQIAKNPAARSGRDRLKEKIKDDRKLSAREELHSIIHLRAPLEEILLAKKAFPKKKKPKGKPLSKKQQAEKDEHPESIRNCMSAREQLDTILFGTDPRPRNPLGEFSGGEEGAPDPNAMKLTYSQAAATGAVSGAAGLGTAAGLKSLYEKLKKAKK